MTSSLTPLLALAAPLVLWPVELVLPYPEIIEELAKAAIIYYGPQSPHPPARIHQAVMLGTIFAFSETILYLLNYVSLGTPHLFILRIIYTVPLHSLTCIIIALPKRSHTLLAALSLAIAISLHFLYNSFLAPYLSVL